MVQAQGREGEGSTTSGIALLEEPGRSVVRLWGEVDLAVRQSAGPVCETVARRSLPVVVDARDVRFVDSAGMSILVRLARDAQAGGYRVELRNAPWMLRELLAVTGVDRLVPLGEDEPPA